METEVFLISPSDPPIVGISDNQAAEKKPRSFERGFSVYWLY